MDFLVVSKFFPASGTLHLTPFIFHAVSLGFIVYSVCAVIILLYIIPHLGFSEIIEFWYPKFYKFLFGPKKENERLNNDGKSKYFKVYVLFISAVIRYLFLVCLYKFSVIHNVDVPLLTPFTIIMGVFGSLVFEITIIQFFVYLGVEFFMEFISVTRFVMGYIIPPIAGGIEYSMLTVAKKIGPIDSNPRQRSNVDRHSLVSKPVSLPSPERLMREHNSRIPLATRSFAEDNSNPKKFNLGKITLNKDVLDRIANDKAPFSEPFLTKQMLDRFDDLVEKTNKIPNRGTSAESYSKKLAERPVFTEEALDGTNSSSTPVILGDISNGVTDKPNLSVIVDLSNLNHGTSFEKRVKPSKFDLDTLLLVIGAYTNVGLNNITPYKLFQKDLGAKNSVDSKLKRVDPNLGVNQFMDFVKDLNEELNNPNYKSKEDFSVLVKKFLTAHFPTVFNGDNWADKDSRKVLGIVGKAVEEMKDQAGAIFKYLETHPDRKIIPISDLADSKLLEQKGPLYSKFKNRNGVVSSIFDFRSISNDGDQFWIEAKLISFQMLDDRFRSFKFIRGGPDYTRAFLYHACSSSLYGNAKFMTVDNMVIESGSYKLFHIPYQEEYRPNSTELDHFSLGFMETCRSGGANAIGFLKNFRGPIPRAFLDFDEIERFINEVGGEVKDFGTHMIIKVDPRKVANFQINNMQEPTPCIRSNEPTPKEDEDIERIEKSLKDWEEVKFFYESLDRAQAKSDKKIEYRDEIIIEFKK